MRRRRLIVALVATVGCVAFTVTGAGADPSHPVFPDDRALLQVFNDGNSEWVGPAELPRITDVETAMGALYSDVEQTVERQKLTFRLPDITAMVYTGTCILNPNGQIIQTGRYGGAGGCPAFQEKFNEAIAATPEAARPAGMFGIGGSIWVQSPPGAEHAFGVFPTVRVNAVAFGSIPVSATVHLSQTVEQGLVQPFTLSWSTPTIAPPPGVHIPGFGETPGFPYNFAPPPELGGTVNIRISDVEIDGVPLSVGGTCAARGDVRFTPEPGFYSQLYEEDPPQKGEPGEFLPLAGPPSYLPGEVDIGAFSACGSGGDDLDPLLTTMISGPANRIEMTQLSFLNGWCEIHPELGVQIGQVHCDLNLAPPQGG